MKGGQLFLVDNKNAMKLIFDEKITIGNLYQITIERERDNIVFIINGQRKALKFTNRMDSDGYMRYKKIILGSDLSLKNFFQGAVGGLKLNGVEMIDIGNGMLVSNVEKVGDVDVIQMPLQNLSKNYFAQNDSQKGSSYNIDIATTPKNWKLGEPFSMRCFIIPDGTYQYRWFKNNVSISSNQTISFKPFTREQAGNYTCKVTVKMGFGDYELSAFNSQFVPPLQAGDKETVGIINNYDKYGYIIYPINSPTSTKEDYVSVTFQTYMSTGTLFSMLTLDGKYFTIKMEKGKLILDINGNLHKTQDFFNNGQYNYFNFERRGNSVNVFINKINQNFTNIDFSNLSNKKNEEITYKTIIIGANHSEKNVFKGGLWGFNWNGKDIIQEVKNGGGERKGEVSIISKQKRISRPIYGILPQKHTKGGFISWDTSSMQKTNKDEIEVSMQPYSLDNSIIRFELDSGNYYEIKMKGGQLFLVDNKNATKLIFDEKITIGNLYQIIIERERDNIVVIINGQRKAFKFINRMDSDGYMRYKKIILGSDLSLKNFFQGAVGGLKFNGVEMINIGNGMLAPNVEKVGNVAIIQMPLQNLTTNYFETHGIINEFDKKGYAIYIIKSPQPTTEDSISFGFKTFVMTGTIVTFVTKNGQYLALKMDNGKLILDLNGNQYETQRIINDGKYYNIKLQRLRKNIYLTLNGTHQDLQNVDMSSLIKPPNNEITFEKIIIGANEVEKDVFRGAIGGMNWNGKFVLLETKDGACVLKGDVKMGKIPLLIKKPTNICQQDYCKNNGYCKEVDYLPYCQCELTQYFGPTCENKTFGIFPQNNSAGGYIILNVLAPTSTRKDELELLIQSYTTDYPLVRFELDNGKYYEIHAIKGQLFLFDSKNSRKILSDKTLNVGSPYLIKLDRNRDNIALSINGQKAATSKLINITDTDGFLKHKKIIFGADRPLRKFFKGGLGGIKLNGENTFNSEGLLSSNVKMKEKVNIVSMPIANMTKSMPMKPQKKDHQARVAEEEFTFGGAAEEEEDEEPKIDINIMNDTIIKSEMQYLNISCNASNLNPKSYVLKWINSKNDVISSNNSLYFKSLLKDKEGKYICVIERNKMKFNKSFNLKISIPKISIQILPDESLRIGGKIHRKCSDLGLDKTTVVDVFSYKWVNEQNLTVSTTDILEIPIKDTALKGTYECHYTSNDTGKIYKARTIADIKDVHVNYQIKILTNPKELKFSEPFTMHCDINPAGEYNYVWFKNNRTISSNRTIYFQSFKTEHSGNYRCQAKIPLKTGNLTLEAETSQQFTAIRHRQIDLYDKPGPTFFVHDGETKEVHCEGTFTKGGKEVDWLINGKIFRVGDIPNVKRSDRRSASILIIRDISPENDGKYECRFGQKSKEVNIIVLLQKAIIKTSPPILTVKETDLAEFHCYVDNIPSFKNVNLKWQFLGKNDTIKYSLSERWKVINDNITTKTSFIELNDAQNRDNGFVICTEPNGETAQSELVVIPNEKNIITITPKEIKVRLGQKFDIECFSKNKREKLSGEPIFTFSNNQTIVNDPRFVIIKIETSHIRLTAPNGLLLSENNMEIFCSTGDSRQSSKIFIRELCPSGHRYCQNSQCLENAKFCDGKFDCSDNSDEDPSVCTSCDPVSKKCEAFNGTNASKNYYLIHWACDGEDDCGNAFDENNCGDGFLNSCGGKYFICSGGKQIPRGYVCDENVDCINGDDESGCIYPSITNTSTYSVKATRTQTITMSCEAVGKPIPTIIWRYNWGCINKLGRISIRSYSPNCTSITSTLTIENFQPGDDGIYNCEALSSRHRAFSKDFQVVLQI